MSDDTPSDEPLRLPPGRLPAGDSPPRPSYSTTPGAPPFGDRHLPSDDGPLSPREERAYAALTIPFPR